MRVLAWKMYGDVKIFSADTSSEFNAIAQFLANEMGSWGEDEKIDEMMSIVAHHGSDSRMRERAIMSLVRPHIGTHEEFEYFGFTNVK